MNHRKTTRPPVAGWALAMIALLPAPAWSEPQPQSQQGTDAGALITSRTERSDGVTELTIGRRLPTQWDAKIGVDVDMDGSWTTPTVESRLDGTWQQDRSSGAGWATVTLPMAPLGWDKAALEARVDPTHDEGTLAATLVKSVPLGSTRLNIKNGYAVTEPIPGPVARPPLTGADALPAPTTTAATENTLSLDILPTATTLSAGAKLSIGDDRWLHSLGAEQKLFGGPLSVTGTVSERTDGDVDGSLTAGFKHKW